MNKKKLNKSIVDKSQDKPCKIFNLKDEKMKAAYRKILELYKEKE